MKLRRNEYTAGKGETPIEVETRNKKHRGKREHVGGEGMERKDRDGSGKEIDGMEGGGDSLPKINTAGGTR